MPASIRQFSHQSAYCIIVSDRELMRVTSHDRTSLFRDCTAQVSSSVGGTELKSGISLGWLKEQFHHSLGNFAFSATIVSRAMVAPMRHHRIVG
jgi:hypothetical protein